MKLLAENIMNNEEAEKDDDNDEDDNLNIKNGDKQKNSKS